MRYFVTGYSFLVSDQYGKEAMGLRNLGIVNLGIEACPPSSRSAGLRRGGRGFRNYILGTY
jgi:hypothetical protein